MIDVPIDGLRCAYRTSINICVMTGYLVPGTGYDIVLVCLLIEECCEMTHKNHTPSCSRSLGTGPSHGRATSDSSQVHEERQSTEESTRVLRKHNLSSHCERIFVIDSLAMCMSVQALPHFFEECHIRLSLLVILWIFPVNINAIQESYVSKRDGVISSGIYTRQIRSPRVVQWSTAQI